MMIDSEILEIIGTEDDGEGINQIADQFREGRKIDDLAILLDSSDPMLVSIGAWILGELHLELYNKPFFINRLKKLVHHEVTEVRFHAFGALYPALTHDEPAIRALINEMAQDPNEGIRNMARRAAKRYAQK